MNQQQLVNQIIKARKIQKDRIEKSNTGIEKQKQAIKDLYEPIVEAVDRSTNAQNRQLQQLEQTMTNTANQNIAAIQHMPQFKHQQEEKRKMIQTGTKRRRLNETSIVEEENEDDVFHDTMSQEPEETQEESLMDYSEFKPKKVNKWVQELYKNFVVTEHQRTTPFDINISTGQLGEKGTIDLSSLLNENKLRFEIDNKIFNVPDNIITEGLMTLLIVPYSSIEKYDLEYNDADIINYVDIMKKVGIKKTAAQKYVKIIKPILEKESKGNRTGRGVSLKSDVPIKSKVNNNNNSKCVMNSQDLFDKLKIMVGSYRAGNNSMQMRNEMRNTVDKLFEVNEIPFTIHRKFYEMYYL